MRTLTKLEAELLEALQTVANDCEMLASDEDLGGMSVEHLARAMLCRTIRPAIAKATNGKVK
jgi:hypothetical protein